MDLSLGQGLLQQTQQGPIQPLEDAEREQSLAKFWGQAPLLLLQQLPDHSEVLSELQRPLQAEGQGTVWPPDPPASQTALPHPSPSFFQFHSSPCHGLLFSPPESDPVGEDVVKPGTQDGSQRQAEGRGLGLLWQSLQSLQHRLQYPADHQSSILTRNAGKFWSERRERTGYEAREIIKPLMEHLGEEGRISG